MSAHEAADDLLWPPDPPDPAAWVDHPPWDRWEEPAPWRDESLPWDSEEERLATWFFDVGMILWEIQSGYHVPDDAARFLPAERWRARALTWLGSACAPPPTRGHRRKAAWRARRDGIAALCAALGERAPGATG